MPSAAPPVLGLVDVPQELRAPIVTAFERVWSGPIEPWDPSWRPWVGVVSRLTAAGPFEERCPQVPVLAVFDGARAARSRGALPANVAWALEPDELHAGFLALALRFALEHGRRRSVERQLEDIRVMADVGWVAGAVSHEIGNLLTSLLTNVELARTRLAAAVDLREPVDLEALLATVVDAHEGARHVSRIAQDLSRASRHGGRLVSVEARTVLETARRLAAKLLEGVEVRLRVRRSGPVRVDETRLCQVFLNLLKNAALSLRDTPSPRIDLLVEQQLDHVVIRIHDNGPGIAREVVPQLFLEGFTTRELGSGLGLALSRRHLEEMGGTLVHVQDASPGACFEVRLPVTAGGAQARPTLVPDRNQVCADVLVVDDMPLIRRAVQRALEPTHRVVAAADFDAALEALARQPFDVGLFDLHMPGRGGIELYEALCARYPGRVGKIVFLSGAFERDDLAYLEQRGLPWVRKPVGAQELRDLVSDLR